MKRVILLIGLLTLLLLQPGAGDDVETQVAQAQLRQLVARVQPAYVFIGGGSGSIISADGYMLTNNHVVASGAKQWRVQLASGKVYVADLCGTAPQTDVAVLKLRGAKDMTFLPLGDSNTVNVGDEVVAIGNPFLLGASDHVPTVTLGIVSSAGITGPNAGEVLVTDTPINPGNSGGPLINKAGEQIGINYAQMPSRFGIKINSGNGYVITINQVKRYLAALKDAKGGTVAVGGFNGVKFAETPTTQAVLRAVEPESPAGQAGLRAGDRIVSVGPWKVLNAGQLIGLTSRYPAGTKAAIAMERDGHTIETTMNLSAPERVGLGVALETASKDSLRVERVLPTGPAARAGLRKGDVIRGVGNTLLPTRHAMATVLKRGFPGMKVPVAVVRDGRSFTFMVELAGESELAHLLRVAATQPDVEPTSQPAPPPTTEPDTPLSPMPE